MKQKILLCPFLTMMIHLNIFAQASFITHNAEKDKSVATVRKKSPEMGIVPITCLTLFVIFHLCCLGAWAIKSAAIDAASEGKDTGKRLY